MAERVEGLISIVAPQLLGSGMTNRITELEKEYESSDWRVALKIAEEVAKQKFCTFKDKLEAIEVGIRVGMAYSTAGIVAAPLEGFIEAKLKKRKDGAEYLAIYYAGPIRGAGGTAAALSVLIADYVRVVMGLAPYDPKDEEIERYVREIQDYNERVTNLQYFPSEKEIRFMVSHLSVEVNGDPTEKIEVSNFKDLERVETNLIRGGICLVIAEGLTQKAPKLWKRLVVWGKEFGLSWDWMREFLDLKAKIHADAPKAGKDNEKLQPNNTFIADAVAGRPVLSFPMATGGFRLRYGRGRTTGLSAASVHPATMAVLNNFIAVGTQLKVERPGKGTALTINDMIDGPIVRLEDGSVVYLDDYHKAKKLSATVKEILFLGDILFNYGDFSENGHKLVPAGYCPEWWLRELEIKSKEDAETFQLAPYKHNITFDEALTLSNKHKIPLHPNFIYYWSLITVKELLYLYQWISTAKKVEQENVLVKIILRNDHQGKEILEKIGISHVVVNKEFIVLGKEIARSLLFTLGFDTVEKTNEKIKHYGTSQPDISTLSILKDLCGVVIRDKAGTFIGARMGRPEKAKMRKLKGSPHGLFPVGEAGGRMRSFQAAMEAGKIESTFALFKTKAGEECLFATSEITGEEAEPVYYDPFRKVEVKKADGALRYKVKQIPINNIMRAVQKKIGVMILPNLIKGIKGTANKDHLPEHPAKAILRAKNNVFVNKDGTVRYDMSELPMTHFKPKEIGTSVEKLKEMGYEKDYYGKELIYDNQILEIKPQDIVIPLNKNLVDESAGEVMLRVAKFIDDLLVSFYKEKPYYNVQRPSDLVGHLVIGLAPHISAGTIGRIIGYSQSQGIFAHPLWHAALRRDCDGDEACVLLLMDGFLNFSRQYLPDRRGSRTMDSPLVLTTVLDPSEVDDMAHGLISLTIIHLNFMKLLMYTKILGM